MVDEDLLHVEDRVRLLVNALANERDPFPRLGLPVERDPHFTADEPISAYAVEARAKGRIVA
jgi:DUF2958 family protein